MWYVIVVILIWMMTISASAAIPSVEVREPNYGPSCAYASTVTLLNVAGRPREASIVRSHGSGPAKLMRLARRLEVSGLVITSTSNGDPAFFNGINNAVISWDVSRSYKHAVLFCGYTSGQAAIYDPNKPDRIRYYTRARFIRYWQRCGGRAFALGE